MGEIKRAKDSVRHVRGTMADGAHTVQTQLGFQKSHHRTDVRLDGSPAGSSLQRWILFDRPAVAWQVCFHGNTFCLLCGAQPECWRGIANDDGGTGGKMNHINDDSKLHPQQNTKLFPPLWVSFMIPPSNGNLTASSGTSCAAAAGVIFQIIWWSLCEWNEADRRGNDNTVKTCEDIMVAVDHRGEQ